MIAPVLTTLLLGLLKANLAAGAAVIAVLALRKPVRARFGARAAYALWLAPLAAAVAVLAPHPQTASPMVQSAQLAAQTAAANVAETFTVQAPAVARAAGPDTATVAFGLWLAGALAAAALVLWRQARFVRAMGRLTASETPRVWRAQSPNVGPAVVGLFRPRIVAPADFEARFAPQERALILAHERMHLAGGDAAINALACAAQCVSWFNPLVHIAVRVLRIDQELACDAAVVGRFPQARRAYAELLLKTQIAARPLPLGCHWPAGADHPLKERIAMLKSPLPAAARRLTGLAVAAALALGAGGLAWAAQPATSDGPGPAERAEAQRQAAAARPEYSCDETLEAKGAGCKIVRTSIWVAVPTPADVARVYPPGARERGQTAKVEMQCATTVKGLMQDCAVVHVNLHVPPGEGAPPSALDDFGAAALKLTRYYQARIPNLPAAARKPGHAMFFVEIGEFKGAVTPVGSLPVASTAQGHAKAASAEARSYQPPVGFAEPRTNGQPPQAPFHSIWLKKPTGEDLVKLYPADAVNGNWNGDTTLSCGVERDGRLSACKVSGGCAAGFGTPPAICEEFRVAALQLAPLFRMRPEIAVGPTGGHINIPIRFALPTDPAAKARLDGLRDPGPSSSS